MTPLIVEFAMRQGRCETGRARGLRREMTPAEAILWQELRGRRFDGLKFRRQTPLGSYVVDFFCTAIGLVIELDGETHLGQEEADRVRQSWLEQQGYRVIRFWNNQAFDEKDAVLEAIWQACQGKGSPQA